MVETETVKKRYDRISRFYDFFESIVENSVFETWRRRYLKDLKGDILEVGVGTGKNLKYYSKDAFVTGIDLSPGMLSKARKKAEDMNNVTLLEMDAQNLKFPDKNFDYVLATFVLCSVPDPVKAAREMQRVLKDDGEIILIEHVLSKNKLIALFEHIHNPVTSRLFGFNVNRDTRGNILSAGLTILEDENLSFFDVFRFFRAK